MANILFLAHRIPYPPNKGDKIRSWNFLKGLAENHNVHAGFFIDNPDDVQYVNVIEELAISTCYSVMSPTMQKLISVRSLFTGEPLTLGAYPYSKLKDYTQQLINADEIDLIFLFSAACGPIVPKDCKVPVITDLVDVDSAKWLAYAEAKETPFPLSWLYERESRTLSEYERYLSKVSTHTYLVSDQEAHLFKEGFSSDVPSISGLKNGVDTDFFVPAEYPVKEPVIIFTGAMDYKPNVEAVEWFVKCVWPIVVAEVPAVKLIVAGGPDNPQIKRLINSDNIEVTGYVASMVDILQQAKIAIAPLKTARGIQNKVLEAMACGLPVVATSQANEGIEAQDKETISIANDIEEFAEKAIELLLNDEIAVSLAANALSFVEENFSWEASFKQLGKDVDKVLSSE